MDLRGQEIFSVGTWNQIAFVEADLDSIVNSFHALSLANKVPLKFGHTDDPGMPAIGWVSRVWREGKKLMADFSDVPVSVYTAIKKRLYKFVSIEALRDVKAGNRNIPWVLDAVALLGADPPAVGDLKALEALSMSRSSVIQGRERVTFRRDNVIVETNQMSITPEEMNRRLAEQKATFDREKAESDGRFEKLEKERVKDKAENRRKEIKAKFEAKVEKKVLLPRSHEKFAALYRLSDDTNCLTVTDADVEAFMAEREEVDGPQIKANDKGGSKEDKKGGKGTDDVTGTAEEVLMGRAEKRVVSLGQKVTDDRAIEEATKFVLKADSHLAKAYFDKPREEYTPEGAQKEDDK